MFGKTLTWATITLLLAVAAFAAGQNDSTDLPEGEGRKILQAACTSCHDLKEVTKFKGFWTKESWQEIVVTMVKYGAPVKDEEIPVLVEYLTRNLGKKN
jgi:hypothetical protein